MRASLICCNEEVAGVDKIFRLIRKRVPGVMQVVSEWASSPRGGSSDSSLLTPSIRHGRLSMAVTLALASA